MIFRMINADDILRHFVVCMSELYYNSMLNLMALTMTILFVWYTGEYGCNIVVARHIYIEIMTREER